MVGRSIWVYIEGGSTGRIADQDFRRGWKKFLMRFHNLARDHGFHTLEVVRGKGRGNAYERFCKHRTIRPDEPCVLLVDSETLVPPERGVWDVVARREGDGWQRPTWANADSLYLMVQFVETWLLTDPDALLKFFGPKFDVSCLPSAHLEKRSKAEIESALKAASRHCGKGEYRHGQAHAIMEFVDPEMVRTLSHGERLLERLPIFIRANGN